MSIERTSPLNPVNAVQSREPNETQTPKARVEKNAEINSTRVKLSDAQTTLTQSDTRDINMERVEALKIAIRNGELKMDTGKIADALIQETQNYLQSN
ncbi:MULTISPECIES: flagellar biosynthesis anti-sigma factor FlgM [Pseudocitrobacter]|mgnify:CR=1 FL=1|uniref:Negative regulator of flagellin synthesis n=1 Tax=Pseudocitrobacter faecalis TaxID=1398493 RepID=A0ABX9FSZ8_9ENTR|nr:MULTISPECIES: flagellar biosynthesis anti-sigma factor FlgM [Pseudocitrobacter]RAU47223.1 anti-sigma-28 factor FlgM [Pseudocitrobacter sp. RIT 415]RBP09485.1 FlgM family anti-sigma-28 factor [Pseudocitrobacter faecalis]GHD92171.1 anti-sigma-28 factor FlgM [Pseudocitrobacter faecalis]